jgi:hypothetical protein
LAGVMVTRIGSSCGAFEAPLPGIIARNPQL